MKVGALTVLVALRDASGPSTCHDVVVKLGAMRDGTISHRKTRLLLDALVSVGLVNRLPPAERGTANIADQPRCRYLARPRVDDDLDRIRLATARYKWARDGYVGARPELERVSA
jgi:hypothetical protein